MSDNGSHAAATAADLIRKIRDWVREDMKTEDISAKELLDQLDMAWLAAERWRIETFDLWGGDDTAPFAGDGVRPAYNA